MSSASGRSDAAESIHGALPPEGTGMTTLSPSERDALLATLEARFEGHMHRHPGMSWEKDCSPESPRGRRSVCFDPEALEARKKHKPAHSAVGLAGAMGATLLNEEEYRRLQQVGPFDTKTSSWIQTPPEIRRLGGALFGDSRYGTVFVYHNGAESYYAARGFRCALRV